MRTKLLLDLLPFETKLLDTPRCDGEAVIVYLMRNGRPPIIVEVEDLNHGYRTANELANENRVDGVAWFIYEADGVCRHFCFMVA